MPNFVVMKKANPKLMDIEIDDISKALKKKKSEPHYIDIEIDRLTSSIINELTGEVFDTEVRRIDSSQFKELKKKGWKFDWKKELLEEGREIYKVHTADNPKIIQGLISLEDKGDSIFIHLIESASFNKGEGKVYGGVPGNLVAHACKVSFEKGYNGYVSFYAKTLLVEHYKKTLGAKILFNNQMYIENEAANNLVNRYYNK